MLPLLWLQSVEHDLPAPDRIASPLIGDESHTREHVCITYTYSLRCCSCCWSAAVRCSTVFRIPPRSFCAGAIFNVFRFRTASYQPATGLLDSLKESL